MITVLRQLPRNVRIMNAVRHAAISVSRTTPLIALRTKMTDPPAGSSVTGWNCRRDLRQQGLDARDHVQR